MRGRSVVPEPPSAAPIDAPRAPPGAPRFVLTRKQWVGLPVLALIPALALAGVFGERTASVSATTRSLGVTVTYPARLRYRQTAHLEIAVTNRAARALDSVHVSLDTAYLAAFVGVHVQPAPVVPFIVSLAQVAPGETRRIEVELSGDRYWQRNATLDIATGDERATVRFSSLVFP
jgi:hypothetical protein